MNWIVEMMKFTEITQCLSISYTEGASWSRTNIWSSAPFASANILYLPRGHPVFHTAILSMIYLNLRYHPFSYANLGLSISKHVRVRLKNVLIEMTVR